MNKLTKVAVITAAVVLGNQAARAQINPGDLVLGFTSSTATTDYVVDLGSLSSLQSAGGTSHLGSLINQATLLANFGGSLSGVNAGVVFGVGNAAAGDFAGVSVLSGSGAPPKPSGGQNVTGAATAANSIVLGQPAVANTLSFTTEASVLTAGTVANELGVSPSQPLTGSTVALDLYESTRLARVGLSTPASAFTFEGTLNLNFSGASPVADFTPAAVPEPSTYGLFAGAGLLVLALRRQFRSSVV